MDVLSDILSLLKLQGTLYFTTEFRPPWGVRVPAFGNVARFHLTLRGRCWVAVEGGSEGEAPEPVLLEAGDLVLVPHGAGHTLASSQEVPLLSVDEVVERAGFTGRGALVYGGGDRGGPTRLVCGHFELDPGPEAPFLGPLPACLVVRRDDYGGQIRLEDLYRYIAREVKEGRPGSDAVVHRLSEILFIEAVRVWAQKRGQEPGLMAALADSNLGASLAAFHEQPARRWTLETLAREGGLSRTVFAQRFRRLVGTSPMRYVTSWRIQKARDLLRRPDISIDAVARQVGYDSAPAFSRIFKKLTGEPPGARRRSHAADAASP